MSFDTPSFNYDTWLSRDPANWLAKEDEEQFQQCDICGRTLKSKTYKVQYENEPVELCSIECLLKCMDVETVYY